MALTGGLPTEARLHRDDRMANPACRWCGAAQGIAAHRLRLCSAPTPTQTRLEPQRREAESDLDGPAVPSKDEAPIWLRGLCTEAVAR